MLDLARSRAITELLEFLQNWTGYGGTTSTQIHRSMTLWHDDESIAIVEYYASAMPELVGYIEDEIGGLWQFREATGQEQAAFDRKHER